MPIEPDLPPCVFISYAWESDAFRESIRELAEWLRSRGCTVICDHDHPYQAPSEGWRTWMLQGLKKAEKVLVICTPKLKARYEKDELPEGGRGSTFEGAIVTASIYNNRMHNDKYCPVLPIGGGETDIPFPLDDWFNGIYFPRDNDKILRIMFPAIAVGGGNAVDDKAEDDGVEWLADGGQGDLALDRLKTAGPSFFGKLQAAFKAAFRTTPPPASAAALVRFFSEYVSEDEDDFSLFNVVQDALWDTADSDPGRRDAEEAAAALYLLAACRLVKRVARHTASDLVLHVPESARIVAAIIATALFGGRLELKPASGSAMPDHPYVFDVPFGGDQPETDFERAAFAAVFSKDPEALEIALDAGPLDESARAALMAQFRRIRRKKHALALVVRGFASAEECRAFAELYAQHRVPVLLPDRQAADVLVGMPVSKLEAEIRLFWHDLKMLSRRGATPHDSAKT